MLNLPSQLKNSTIYMEEPFKIYEIENFVDDTLYKNLVDEANDFNQWTYQFEGRGEKKKAAFTRSDLTKIKQPYFKKFVQLATDKKMYDWFKSTHLPYFKSKKIKIFLKNPRSIYSKLIRQLNKLLQYPLSFYSIEVESSLMSKGSSIAPHTDAGFKRLSIVLYLANEPVNNEMSSQLGTVFYGIKENGKPWERWKTNLLNEEETLNFLKDYEIKHVCRFRPNACAGFIKSDISWHGVLENTYNYERRALVVNIFEK